MSSSASIQQSSSGDSNNGAPPMAAFPPQMKKKQDSVVATTRKTEEDESLDDSTKTETTSHTEQEDEEAAITDIEEVVETPEEEVPPTQKFERGDHVYQWCSLLGVPRAFQHHGIVIHVEEIPSLEGEEEVEQLLTIADFSNLLFASQEERGSSSGSAVHHHHNAEDASQSDYLMDEDEDGWHSVREAEEVARAQEEQQHHQRGSRHGSLPILQSGSIRSGSGNGPATHCKNGVLRVYTTTSTKDHKWHKVAYSANWFQAHVWKRSGTCTPAACDPPEVVMSRVNFLLTQSSLHNREDASSSVLPKYHSIYANCECLSVWCKTGNWSTLQAASMLGQAAVTQAKGTATLAGFAAAQTVTVPAAGVWGWMGFSTTVPLMTANPLILPALCAYGTVSVGLPAVYLAMAKSKWNKTTKQLNEALEAQTREVALVT